MGNIMLTGVTVFVVVMIAIGMKRTCKDGIFFRLDFYSTYTGEYFNTCCKRGNKKYTGL